MSVILSYTVLLPHVLMVDVAATGRHGARLQRCAFSILESVGVAMTFGCGSFRNTERSSAHVGLVPDNAEISRCTSCSDTRLRDLRRHRPGRLETTVFL